MARFAKPAGTHYVLAVCLLTSIVSGWGWLQARSALNGISDQNRDLAAEVSAVKDAVDASRRQADEYRTLADEARRDLEREVANSTDLKKQLTAALEEKEDAGAEMADGVIRWIDPVGKKVWINLGEADGLRPRTTFSVYSKRMRTTDADGKATPIFATDEIKATIEVTRILEAHLSEGRILMERFDHPIAKGDPIKSMTWGPGTGEAFSIIGIVDLDGDGTDDRDLLKEAIATAGGVIDNDVDEKGILHVNGRIPRVNMPRLTTRTKFLVIGKIPEIAPDATPAEVAALQKIVDLRQELETAARKLGVRVVSLSDFLKYLGYKSHAGLNVPKGDEPYNVKPEKTFRAP